MMCIIVVYPGWYILKHIMDVECRIRLCHFVFFPVLKGPVNLHGITSRSPPMYISLTWIVLYECLYIYIRIYLIVCTGATKLFLLTFKVVNPRLVSREFGRHSHIKWEFAIWLFLLCLFE